MGRPRKGESRDTVQVRMDRTLAEKADAVALATGVLRADVIAKHAKAGVEREWQQLPVSKRTVEKKVRA